MCTGIDYINIILVDTGLMAVEDNSKISNMTFCLSCQLVRQKKYREAAPGQQRTYCTIDWVDLLSFT